MTRHSRTAAVFVLAASWIATACSVLKPQADPSRFFVLTSLIEAQSDDIGEPRLDVSIGLRDLDLAPYLDRSELVTRVSENEVDFAAVDRWAEPPAEGIRRVLEKNLQVLLRPRTLESYPWLSNRAPDYVIDLAVSRFERSPDGDAELLASWTISAAQTGFRSDVIHTRIAETVASDATEALVDGMSRTLARLSREIAEVVRQASRTR